MRINLLNNLTLKIGAVVLALLLWIHVVTNKAYEYQMEVALRVVNVPEGLILVSDVPPVATVRIKTTGKQLFAMLAQNYQLPINAAQFHEGSFERDLTGSDAATAFDRPYENVDIVFPRKLFLRFERITDRSLLVESEVHTLPAPGFAVVGRPKIEPEMIQVTGPTSMLRGLKSIKTRAIEVANLNQDSSVRVALSLPDSAHLSLSDSMVTVTFHVEPIEERTINNLPILPPAGFDGIAFKYIPEKVSLHVGVPATKLGTYNQANIRASFHPLGTYADSAKSAIRYQLPSGLIVTNQPPDSVLILRRQ